jgi:hypothetical protein
MTQAALSCRGVARCRHLLLAGECALCPGNALDAPETLKVSALERHHHLTRGEAIRLVRTLGLEVSSWSGGMTLHHG